MASEPTTGEQLSPCDLTRFFEGRAVAWGVFEDRFGTVKRRFQIELDGRWVNEASFELSETFTFSDGETETRIWELVPSPDDRSFIGRCSDAVGLATGAISPGMAAMRYTFRLKMKDRAVNLEFHDRFYPVGDDGLLNRTRVTKWGIKVGEVTAFFQRQPVHEVARAAA
ncbi:MAG: DUF3833 family protein [Pseudomonadota bacterium]